MGLTLARGEEGGREVVTVRGSPESMPLLSVSILPVQGVGEEGHQLQVLVGCQTGHGHAKS